MPDPAVALENVSLVFGDDDPRTERVVALDDVSLQIQSGQFVAIVGPSGCGKTTILNMLAGLIRPTLGSASRHGAEVEGPSRDIGYMLARSALSPWRTALQNVELGLEIRGEGKIERRQRATELLAQLRSEPGRQAFGFGLRITYEEQRVAFAHARRFA